ncbi:hypothetical protein G6F57_016252 [Rhizopus arrhizus]|nr:hypothetical protein G6F57_016252 [Rhizopus arrhizus]
MGQPHHEAHAQQDRQGARQAHQATAHGQDGHGPRQGAAVAPMGHQSRDQRRADRGAEGVGGNGGPDRLDLGVQAIGHRRHQAGHHEFRQAECKGADGKNIDSNRHGTLKLDKDLPSLEGYLRAVKYIIYC